MVKGDFPEQLRRYWLGKGLSRWATSPTPYRTLVVELRSENVPRRMVKGLAARLYRQYFGRHPGRRSADFTARRLARRLNTR